MPERSQDWYNQALRDLENKPFILKKQAAMNGRVL